MTQRNADAERQGEGTPTYDVLVVGGGASGLSAAHTLAAKGRRVALLERAGEVGGNLWTQRDGDWQTEIGPNTLIMKPPLYALLRELGMLDEAQSANAQARKRFVAFDGRPVALPTHLMGAFNNPLIGRSGWAGILREPFVRCRTTSEPSEKGLDDQSPDEESLADFVARRLGRRVLEYMVDPFVSGVYAGDPARLSAQAAMPRLVALEREYGSLIRGGLTRLYQSRRAPSSLPSEWRGRLVSFPQGLQRLAEGLACAIRAKGGEIHCHCEISRLHQTAQGWHLVDTTGRSFRARELVLATSAPVAAGLLAPLDPALAAPLEAIAYPPVNAIALGFRDEDIEHPLDGFGLLIPAAERRRTLGVLFSSTLFPDRAPDGHKLLNAFIGGRRQPEAAEGDDNALVAQVIHDLRDLLGIRAAPVWQRVSRWPRAIPQYELGHLARLERLDEALSHHEGLSLLGNWRDGIAVGDCLENGRRLGERLSAGQA